LQTSKEKMAKTTLTNVDIITINKRQICKFPTTQFAINLAISS